jgi:hypothetical protein
MKKIRDRIRNRKGQILVAMIILMLLSLSLGISISSGFIKNIRSQTQADDLTKAQAASEALIEKLLLISNDTLETYIQGNSCGSVCTWQVTDTTGKIISASASLSYAGNSTAGFSTDLETISTFQLNLKTYTSGKTVDICWSTPASIYASYIKETAGVITTKAYAYNAANTTHSDNGLSSATAKYGYTSCFTVTATETPDVVRLKSYYLDTPIYVVPQSGQLLPKQGVLIASTGKSGSATRKITVMKTTNSLPAIFDYAIYQKSGSDPLSNVTL